VPRLGDLAGAFAGFATDPLDTGQSAAGGAQDIAGGTNPFESFPADTPDNFEGPLPGPSGGSSGSAVPFGLGGLVVGFLLVWVFVIDY